MLRHFLKTVNLQGIRDYILDAGITDADTILLHQIDFDNLVLEYRELYKESMQFPFLILGVLIKEDDTWTVVPNRLHVIQNDLESQWFPYEDDEPDLSEPLYRCGWCGNIVDYDGTELTGNNRQYAIRLIEKHTHEVSVKHINGKCCKYRESTAHSKEETSDPPTLIPPVE